MPKRNIVLILILVLVIGLGIYYWTAIRAPEESGEEVEKEFSSEDRSATFNISSGGGEPVFAKELFIDPFKNVREGEKQTFSIWAKDKYGIKKVSFTTFTDLGEEVTEMELVEGDTKEGKWFGSWITKNISSRYSYQTKFIAENINGETTKLTLSWTTE